VVVAEIAVEDQVIDGAEVRAGVEGRGVRAFRERVERKVDGRPPRRDVSTGYWLQTTICRLPAYEALVRTNLEFQRAKSSPGELLYGISFCVVEISSD